MITEQQTISIIEQYCNNQFSSEKIAKNIGIHSTTVLRTLHKNNIKIRPAIENKRKYKINQYWLDNIDTEIKAYFYGLMLSDGNVHKKKNDIKISLNPKDKDILEKLSLAIYGQIKINTYKNESILLINSKIWKEKLIELGCMPNKTFQLQFPNWLDKNLYNHFVRGVLDGDGCLSISKKKKPVVDFTGNLLFITELKTIIKNILNIDCYFSKNKNSYSIQITGINKIKTFIIWLYNDSTIYLDRKYNKHLEMMKL